jgi:hypothetical protein
MNDFLASVEKSPRRLTRHSSNRPSPVWHAYRVIAGEVSVLSECRLVRWTLVPQDPWETLQSEKCRPCQDKTGAS